MTRAGDVVENWTAAPEPGGIALRRETTCGFCCKRKRAWCSVCGGTGLTVLEYHLTLEQWEALAVSGAAAARALRG